MAASADESLPTGMAAAWQYQTRLQISEASTTPNAKLLLIK